MLDIKFIRENLQTVKTGLDRRNGNNHDLDALLKQEDEFLYIVWFLHNN